MGLELEMTLGGPGVVGVAGRINYRETHADYDSPNWGQVSSQMAGIGVYGFSADRIGVAGIGKDQGVTARREKIGVQGMGGTGPGGHFSSKLLEGKVNNAQVHIEAQQMSVPSVVEEAKVYGIRPTVVDQLPRTAKPGDLLLTLPMAATDYQLALLWICTGDQAGVALWQQVLLGEIIKGTR
jgi:hypothetical protein